jgi:hypothetical protein
METMEVVYYTCLNNDCPKHRNIFTEGDPEHANCARERLYLEGERKPASWLPLIVTAAVSFAAAGAAVLLILRARAAQKPQLPMIREESLPATKDEQLSSRRSYVAEP